MRTRFSPNDGILIKPHVIRRVVQGDGLPLKQVAPQVKDVISVETARTMMKLLEAVPVSGTAAIAGATLKHPLGGKTGTTNGYTDAWFVGFSPSVTCGTWIGFDDRKSLGDKETGAKAALPMWIDFMKVVVARTPVENFPRENAPKKTLDIAAGSDTVTSAKKNDVDEDDDDQPAGADTQRSPVAQPAPSATPAEQVPDDAPEAPGPRPAAPAAVPATPRGMVNSPVGPYRPYTGPAVSRVPSAASPSSPAIAEPRTTTR